MIHDLRLGRLAVCFGLALTLIGMSAMSAPATAEPREFQISSGAAPDTLREFGRQADLQTIFSFQLVKDLRTQAVLGRYEPEDALTRMLAGTALIFDRVNERTIAIVPARDSDASGLAAFEDRASAAERSRIRLAQAAQDADESRVRSGDAQASDPVPEWGIPEILVIGARSSNVDLKRSQDDPQPYYIVDSEQLELSGAADVEEFFKERMPMNTVARTNSQLPPGSAGVASSINLRNLGDLSTIILINGRRTIGGGNFGTHNQFDVNGIPIGAIQRIEVLPSSAAAIYGGSAIGGVVNIVLKRDMVGGDFRVKYASPFDVSAPEFSVDAVYGWESKSGGTNLTLAANFADSDAIYNRERAEIYQRGIDHIKNNSLALLFAPTLPAGFGGSTNIGSVSGANLVLKPQWGGQALNSPLTYLPAGTLGSTDPLVLGQGLFANAGDLDLDLADSVARSGQRGQFGSAPRNKSFSASFRQQLGEKIELFSEFLYYRTESSTTVADSGTIVVPASAPSNPFQQDVRLFVPYRDPFVLTSGVLNRRFVLGFLFDLPAEWRGQGDYTWNSNTRHYSSEFTQGALSSALTAGALNPFVDSAVADTGLTPYRAQFGTEAPSYIHDFGLRASGPLFRLPGGRVRLTTGLGFRREGLKDQHYYQTAPLTPTQDYEATYLSHHQKVTSFYTEANVPLLSPSQRVPGVHSLDLQLAGRIERYEVETGPTFIYTRAIPSLIASNPPLDFDTVTHTSTKPTIGLRYAPIPSIVLRASFAEAFLPPSYTQLLPGLPNNGFATSSLSVIDPLRGNQPLAQVPFVSGGNAGLDPQQSESLNFGIIFEPAFLPGFRLNLEKWKTDLSEVIVTPTAQQIINNEAQFPGRVTRAAPEPGDPFGVGQITFIDFSALNAAKGTVSGYDATLSYQTDIGAFGALDFVTQATYIDEYRQQTVTNGPYPNTVGFVSNGSPLRLRGYASLGWEYNRWYVNWAANFFGSYKQNTTGASSTNPGIYVTAQGSAEIPSQTYHNLTVSYRIPQAGSGNSGWTGQMLSGTTIDLGIRNVFDKVPPVDVFYSGSYYYSPFGDARLRSYSIAVRKPF